MKKPERAPKPTEFRTDLFESRWISPSRRVPKAVQKLMIVLHGRGDSLESYRTIREELALPNMNYLLLNAPRKYDSGFSWYALEPRHERGIRGVRKKLFALVEELKGAGWKSENIFFLGHSQGCLIACDLVLNHPDAFGGLIGVSGYLWFFRGWRAKVRQSGAPKTPWLITHGVRDRIIRPQEIREDISELISAVPVLYREFKKGHDFDYDDEVPFIRDWLMKSPARRKALCLESFPS